MDNDVVAFGTKSRRRAAAARAARRYPARIARQLALAHALQRRVDTGEFADYADMARALGFTGMVVRPLLMSAGKQVGAVGMAVDAELDRATGCVKLEPNKPITVAFLLGDESAASVRVIVQDPATDAELYRSPTDIPVRLGV